MARDGTPSGGRPRGRLNDKTLQVQAFCRSICEDRDYQQALLQRARTNALGGMEPVIWAYAYGKPKDSLDVRLGRLGEELNDLSLDELTARCEELTKQLRDASELEGELVKSAPLLPAEVTAGAPNS